LAQLRLMPGKADGKFGAMTHQAMVTLQKLYGVRRDGIVDAVSQHILLGARPASMPAWARGFRAGIDIDRQVMFFYRGREFQVIGISSGSGKTYQSPESTVLHVAITPRGRFRIQRRVSGPDVSPLGILYDPGYFIGDYAIHGSAFVPPWPASHGCIRVDMLLRRYVAAALPVGAPIKIR